MSCKRLLYAPNVHQGGGKSLLLPILEELKGMKDVIFVLDTRMVLPEQGLAGEVYRVKPTVFSRLWFEWHLKSLISSEMILLCMGNLPPLFAHQGKQRVFVQNRYLIDKVALSSLSMSVRIRLVVERWWLRSRSKYAESFFVQTATMKSLLDKQLGRCASVLPFAVLPIKEDSVYKEERHKVYDFVYVASGEPHKQHRALIAGWVELAKQNLFPSLCLTLDAQRFPELCAWIQKMKESHDLYIDIKGELTHQDIYKLYNVSKAMIYPSTFESFGVPLLEAAALSMPIVTADIDYVYDVIKPTATFDVGSPESIANAVKNMTARPANIISNISTVEDFLEKTFDISSLRKIL